MKQWILWCCCAALSLQAFCQQDNKKQSPYTLKLGTDALVTGAGVGLTLLGYKMITDKKDLTLQELAAKSKDNIPFFDKGNAGFYSEKADKDSYLPFYASFTYPVVMLLGDGAQRSHAGQVLTLYLETMSIAGAFFTITAGGIHRSRPLVYGSTASTDYKRSSNNQRSFFAGHTEATAAASFFAAKVFADFHPDSKAKTYVWIVAAATPAVVGYLRYKAGMHFLSDNILGYAIGAATGILVPQLHKTKVMERMSIIPQAGPGGQGVAVVYRL